MPLFLSPLPGFLGFGQVTVPRFATAYECRKWYFAKTGILLGPFTSLVFCQARADAWAAAAGAPAPAPPSVPSDTVPTVPTTVGPQPTPGTTEVPGVKLEDSLPVSPLFIEPGLGVPDWLIPAAVAGIAALFVIPRLLRL